MIKPWLKLLDALICAFSFGAAPVYAQSVGAYGGLQANGLPFTLTVQRYKGRLIVESFNAQVQTTCRDGTTLITDSGYGPVGPITSGSGQDALDFGAYYGSVSYTFDDTTHSVSGFVTQIFSEFVRPSSSSNAPLKSTFCTSGNQAFAAVLGRHTNSDPKLQVVIHKRPS